MPKLQLLGQDLDLEPGPLTRPVRLGARLYKPWVAALDDLEQRCSVWDRVRVQVLQHPVEPGKLVLGDVWERVAAQVPPVPNVIRPAVDDYFDFHVLYTRSTIDLLYGHQYLRMTSVMSLRLSAIDFRSSSTISRI